MPLVGATSRLLATCRAARGEAAFWSAARAALACTSPAGGQLRGDRDAYPFDSAVVRSGAFEATEEHCAKATRTIATIPARGDESGCTDGEPRPVTLVGWQHGLLRRLCLAGVAATSGLAGGLTYWVCTGGAVVASGAGCTVVAPGVGTVGCGAAGGTIAQPVCASGGLAVAAGAAAAGLEACNVVTSPSTVAPLDSLEEYARRIPGTYPCQRSFEPERCELQAPPPGWRGPFHRLSTPASAFLEKCAAETCELWGSGYRGGFPCAQAYRGPLPAGQAGFEFYTEAEPRGGGELQRWCALEDMPDPLIHREDTHGAIRIAITKAQN